jgi:hypothetical protein
MLQVYAGETSMVRDNLLLGQLHVLAGDPGEELDVTLDVSIDGILNAHVVAKGSGKSCQVSRCVLEDRAVRYIMGCLLLSLPPAGSALGTPLVGCKLNAPRRLL